MEIKRNIFKQNTIEIYKFHKLKKRKNNKNPFKKGKYFILLIKILFIVILSVFLYKVYNFLEKYQYCYECIEKKKDKNSECLKCPNEILFKHLYIVSTENTLNEIVKNHKSISRFGDGEMEMIFGGRISFQKKDNSLGKRLYEVLNSNETNLLIGLYFPYQKKFLNSLFEFDFKFWKKWLYNNKFRMLNMLKKRKYYSTDISRFYTNIKDKSKVYKYIPKLKKIWEGRDVLVIEGEKTRFGIGNDLLNNAKSIKRILCPTRNAYNLYDKILNATLKVDKNYLIIIALGPTATVLAYDLTKYGYQAVDLGHADIQYELYLRHAKKHIYIPYKYVSEYDSGRNEASLQNAPDKRYYEQIIDKILN